MPRYTSPVVFLYTKFRDFKFILHVITDIMQSAKCIQRIVSLGVPTFSLWRVYMPYHLSTTEYTHCHFTATHSYTSKTG